MVSGLDVSSIAQRRLRKLWKRSTTTILVRITRTMKRRSSISIIQICRPQREWGADTLRVSRR